jgi:hypothetical protein
VQEARFLNYWHNGGREKKLGLLAHAEVQEEKVEGKVMEAINAAREEAQKAIRK